MTFPPAPKEDPVSEDQALPTNEPVELKRGETGGVTVNVIVDMSSNSAITTVVDAEGNVQKIENLSQYVLKGTENITIFLKNAPTGSATVSIETISTILTDSSKSSATADAIIDLLENYGNNTANRLSIKSFVLRESSSPTDFITYTETFKTSAANLSKGNDAHATTVLGNTIYGNKGDDLFIVIPSGTRNATSKAGRTSFISMGKGEDTLAITKGALREKKSKVVLRDFSSKNDQVSLDATKKQVQGIGTKKLTISTKKGSSFVIKTEDGKFRKSDIEFT